MRILFFTENFPPETNAAATRVYERALYWIKKGHKVTVITSIPNFPLGKVYDGYINRYQKEKLDTIDVVRVKTYIASNKGMIRRIIDFLSFMVMGYLAAKKEERPDIVVSTSPQFFAAVSAWWFSKRNGLPYVFELGDLWPASIVAVGAMRQSFILDLLERLELRMYNDADAVIALTRSFKKNLVARGVKSTKIAVIRNGVDTWRYIPTKRDHDFAKNLKIGSEFVVGYVGTLGMAHALENVIDAAETLKEDKNICFLFAGAGAKYNYLQKETENRGLKNIKFLPKQPKSKMQRVWSLCDVSLVHLKNSDVFSAVIPSKIFEAMSMGLPILFAGPLGETSKIIQRTGSGICIAPETPGLLAEKVVLLQRKPELYQELAERSLASAALFSRETQANHMIAVLEAVVSGNGENVSSIRA
ncbi:MAG: D-inositol-3-phosphate glycosyltransferase [Alphaproteobacteria bacterium MarineAlpha3_Bin5]|nr:glycosyltransferase WbuB [Magnetovibrio sp.]PPR80208.1 MAG: D-inositol-3-phosphate glycosyltransferase [Alphaproteobacteria bacterium MarineAlpha3_Bin5]